MAERRTFFSIRAVMKEGNTYSIPLLSEIFQEKILSISVFADLIKASLRCVLSCVVH